MVSEKPSKKTHSSWGEETGVAIEPDWTLPPGDSLEEELECASLTIKQASEKTGIPYPVFQGLLTGAVPITDEIAEALAKITGYNAQFWLRSEQNYQADLERLGRQRPASPEAERYYAAIAAAG